EDLDRCGAGGHELTQRHQVTLAGQTGERTPDVHRRRAGSTAVAGLVAPARPTGAGLAWPDLAGGGLVCALPVPRSLAHGQRLCGVLSTSRRGHARWSAT